MKMDRKEYYRQWRAKHPGRNAEACRKWKAANPEYKTVHAKGYWIKRRDEGRTAQALRKYRASHPGEHYKRVKAYWEANPEKYRATQEVLRAIRHGKLHRLPCEACGKPKTHAHHTDYSKPLDVRWLCALCHKQAHKTQ